MVNNDNYMLNLIDHKLQGHLVDIFLELVKTSVDSSLISTSL